MPGLPAKLYFPDILESWPWPRRINSYFAEVKVESDKWIEGFRAFDARGVKAFNKCNFGLLSSIAYPIASREHLRTGCDLMNLFFVFDDITDEADVETVQELANNVMDALRHPHRPRPSGESVVGEIARQFWARAIRTASPTSMKRFIDTFDAYVESVVDQAKDRSDDRIRTVDNYMELRRLTIGGKPSFALLELGMDLPDGVIEHPVMEKLTEIALDLIILGNDIYSYNKEQAANDDAHNIVTVIMYHHHETLSGAMDWIEREMRRLVDQFGRLMRVEPFWPEEFDDQVYEYINGLGNWVRANDSWSFESGRYFGNDGLRVQKERTIVLSPRSK
ncbi:terpenoid synthase [Mucidula mucida]|nr:terpenoid synthase [Mucidula mucida]